MQRRLAVTPIAMRLALRLLGLMHMHSSRTLKRLTRTAISAGALMTLAACGAAATNEHTESASPRYAGTCTLAGIDEVPAPAEQKDDSVAMVARYSFGSPAPADAAPWSLRFQVARARAHDLQLHLQAHATVLCNPDHTASSGEAAHIEVPPFEGQTGQPIP